MWNVLAYGALPLWLLAGAADWWCHRRTLIEHTSGPRESLLHLLLYAEIAIPLVLGLFLELTTLLLALMSLGVAAHMVTSLIDTAFAQPRRHIAPIEHQIHSALEMLPLFAVVLAMLLNSGLLAQPDWGLRPPTTGMPGSTRTVILVAVTGGALLILEELSRGLRAARN